jgi:hypothetical protein
MNKKVFIIAACLVLFLFAAGSVFAQPIRSARLKIVSNVRGAQVFVDGRSVGRAPTEVRVPLGRHTVRVTAAGYDDFERAIDVRRDEGIQANLNRMRREFTLSIQANVPQAEVWINGDKQRGFAPMNLRLPQGRYQVRVSKRGYGTFENTVNLNRNERVMARLSAPRARIIIEGPRGRGAGALRIEVWLDGRRMNGTDFQVEPGRHTIRVNASGLLADREVNCRAGRVYRFMLDLDLQAPREADN